MKRCPECDSNFPDADQFCELDGTILVADYSDNNTDASADRAPQTVSPAGARGYQVSRDGPTGETWKILTIMAIAGVAIGIVLFFVYQRLSRDGIEQSSSEPPSNDSVRRQQIPPLPLRPSPSVSVSPSPEPSPSPSPMPSPGNQAESARVALSSSPVSTGGDKKAGLGQLTIRLTNGTAVEADEVWETGEGIWYRRHGVVTLLERDQVKAIERPSPASSPTPATSPTASP